MRYLEWKIENQFEDRLYKKYSAGCTHEAGSLYDRLYYLYEIVDQLVWSEDLYEEEEEE